MLKEVFLSEISKEESLDYYHDIRVRNPELFDELETLAKALVRFQKKDISSSELIEPFKVYLTKHPETNPIYSGDTLGVKMFLDVVADDKEIASKTKRLYNNIFSSMLRQRYEK